MSCVLSWIHSLAKLWWVELVKAFFDRKGRMLFISDTSINTII
jgi:hypothetical protein